MTSRPVLKRVPTKMKLKSVSKPVPKIHFKPVSKMSAIKKVEAISNKVPKEI